MEGISINIPVYNIDVTTLVKEITRQCQFLAMPFEVNLIDDCSSLQTCKEANRSIAGGNIHYSEQSQNMGRSCTRNQLARQSAYEHLLYMDCDSKIIASDFVEKYWGMRHLPIVVGGCVFRQEPPQESQLLRWRYEMYCIRHQKDRESQAQAKIFRSCNFMIDREVLLSHPFNERLTKYGHEDTLIGIEFEKAGIAVTEINNPVLTTDIDPNDQFLAKSRNAVENLYSIYTTPALTHDITTHVTLLKALKLVEKTHTKELYRLLFSATRSIVEKNLKGNNPCIYLLQWYKLGHLITTEHEAIAKKQAHNMPAC